MLRRALAPFVLGSFLMLPAPALAQWVQNGVPVCGPPCRADEPSIVADGSGGVLIMWRDYRTALAKRYVQRLTASGEIAPGWPPDGFATSTDPAEQQNADLASDGEGGAIVVWEVYGPGFNELDLYAQRVTGAGTVAPGWPAAGFPVSTALKSQHLPRVCLDGVGGGFITWEDLRAGTGKYDIYAHHLTAAGAIAPGWPVNGLVICDAAGSQGPPRILADGTGGAFIVWNDPRSFPALDSNDLYAQRVTGTGALAPGWNPNGNQICSGPSWRGAEALAPDGAGGLFVAFVDYSLLPLGYPDYYAYANVYAQRVTANGAVAPGWPTGGVPICTAADYQDYIAMAPDGAGGALLVWDDYRTFYDSDCYVQRVTGAGGVAPGWPVDGRLASTAPGYQFISQIAADGQGGAYVVYENLAGDYRVYAQHLTGAGGLAPGWIATGTPLVANPQDAQTRPVIVSDGVGGAIAAWEDSRAPGVYAQRLVPDGPVAVAVALVSAVAEPDHVHLTWHAADGAGLAATVERRSASSAWQALATIAADGTGALEYEDRAVVPGTRYGYRLRYRDGATETLSAETWVDVPRVVEFALEGLRPNPAVGELTAAFSLPNDAPATLELLDVSGRRIVGREVGALGVGRHVVRMTDGLAIAPGMYWLRLTQSGRSRLARGVVVR